MNDFTESKALLRNLYGLDFPDALFHFANFLKAVPDGVDRLRRATHSKLRPTGVLKVLLAASSGETISPSDASLSSVVGWIPELFTVLRSTEWNESYGDWNEIYGLLLDDPSVGFRGAAVQMQDEYNSLDRSGRIYGSVFDVVLENVQGRLSNLYDEETCELEDDPEFESDDDEEEESEDDDWCYESENHRGDLYVVGAVDKIRFCLDLMDFMQQYDLALEEERPEAVEGQIFDDPHFSILLDYVVPADAYKALSEPFDPYSVLSEAGEPPDAVVADALRLCDEGYPGAALELGRAFWMFSARKSGYRLLRAAYGRLNRGELVRILDELDGHGSKRATIEAVDNLHVTAGYQPRARDKWDVLREGLAADKDLLMREVAARTLYILAQEPEGLPEAVAAALTGYQVECEAGGGNTFGGALGDILPCLADAEEFDAEDHESVRCTITFYGDRRVWEARRKEISVTVSSRLGTIFSPELRKFIFEDEEEAKEWMRYRVTERKKRGYAIVPTGKQKGPTSKTRTVRIPATHTDPWLRIDELYFYGDCTRSANGQWLIAQGRVNDPHVRSKSNDETTGVVLLFHDGKLVHREDALCRPNTVCVSDVGVFAIYEWGLSTDLHGPACRLRVFTPFGACTFEWRPGANVYSLAISGPGCHLALSTSVAPYESTHPEDGRSAILVDLKESRVAWRRPLPFFPANVGFDDAAQHVILSSRDGADSARYTYDGVLLDEKPRWR